MTDVSDVPYAVTTPECTISYPHLFVPQPRAKNKEPDYHIAFLFDVGTDLSTLQQAVLQCAIAAFGENAPQLIKAGVIKQPFRKQLEKAVKGKEGYSSDETAIFINAASSRPPGVVDRGVNRITNAAEVWGGQRAIGHVNPYAYNHPEGGPGISFGLLNVQIVSEGTERFGGKSVPPDQVFKPLDPTTATDVSNVFGTGPGAPGNTVGTGPAAPGNTVGTGPDMNPASVDPSELFA